MSKKDIFNFVICLLIVCAGFGLVVLMGMGTNGEFRCEMLNKIGSILFMITSFIGIAVFILYLAFMLMYMLFGD